MGLGTGPVVLAPLSEFFGRRPIYVVSWAAFIIWTIPCAVATNIQTMLVGRFIDGICGSTFMSVAGGTVTDLFQGEELGLPMIVYYIPPLHSSAQNLALLLAASSTKTFIGDGRSIPSYVVRRSVYCNDLPCPRDLRPCPAKEEGVTFTKLNR
jgi:MFS family permease